MAGFGKNSGPSLNPKPNPFANLLSPPNPNPNPHLTIWTRSSPHPLPSRDEDDILGLYNNPNSNARRPSTSPSWDNNPKQPVNASYTMNPQRLSPISASTTTHFTEANIPTKPHNLTAAKRTRSPPLPSREDDILGLYNPPNSNARRPSTSSSWDDRPTQQVNASYITNTQRLSPASTSNTAHVAEANIPIKPNNIGAAKRTRTPPFQTYEDDILGLYNPPNPNAGRLAMSPGFGNQPKTPVDLPSIMNYQTLSSIAANSTTLSDTVSFPSKLVSADRAKRVRTPLPSHENDSLAAYNETTSISKMHDSAPQRIDSQHKSPNSASGSSSLHMVESSLGSPSLLRVSYPNPNPKRTRSPPLQPADTSSTSSSIHLESEREIQAKAKRLARFNVELRQPLQTSQDLSIPKLSTNKHDRVQEAHDVAGISDYEGMRSSKVVVGLCPDMCPVQERDERERKGDLDKFERLGGERNQTTEFLAVKKYNRTAEREADLIRPLPVLRKTVDYLLNLLDQPYNESFLEIYNFLWDRMRAIRMDLRMQHIFNQEAILMLEQMIRLHIAAMHELCEYKKGEGFVEGFDAHLNIEQMNKTSVELFQMYEDHSKRGISISTEREFRGYYALLKLDKHPGYKVEPSELSLDLAKMTPQMRCTQEILFARDVARACRVGNYIAFFRLARKATYLQACLMHAHFAKLRTQALASLHSGLQNNQGIPVSDIVKWLCMEGEDIESLLEYHGFSLRKYEEVYMVKEGPFLNIDTDFPTKCSSLVHLKRSKSIVDNVKSGPSISELTEERMTGSETMEMITDQRNAVLEEMLPIKVNSTPRILSQPQPPLEGPIPVVSNREDDRELTDVSLSVWNVDSDREMTNLDSPVGASLSDDESISDQEQHVDDVRQVGYVGPSSLSREVLTQAGPSSPSQEVFIQSGASVSSNVNSVALKPILLKEPDEDMKDEEVLLKLHQKEEVLREKLKLIIRKWKERSSALRAIREQKDFLASAALSSLSLGPSIRRRTGPSLVAEELNIDNIARTRYEKLGNSWARFDVSDLVAPILSTRNPDAKCISWKLLYLVQANSTGSQTYDLASKWLLSKLMGPADEGANDSVLVASQNLSIWNKWIGPPVSQSPSCCLSIIREMRLFNNNQPFSEDDVIAGSSCLLFLASGSISWDIQRVQLRRILLSIPDGSNLPLLIVSIDPYDPLVDIIQTLGLHEVDRTKISSSSVISIQGDSFFDNDQLKAGLQWLANHSPHQPIVHPVSIHDLVSSHLRRLMAPLDNLKTSEVGPHDCISAFNEALSLSTEEIVCAASKNPNNWPSPEISLIEKSDIYLPTVGWSAAERIELIISALNSCRLPNFPSDLSTLNRGLLTVSELQKAKEAIEESIASYLLQLTRLLDHDFALREASVMVQKGFGLVLRDTHYHIVPKWPVIFRRIFNWQLMRLSETKLSDAYVSARKEVNESENLKSSFYSETSISFDELVAVSCRLPLREQPSPAFKPKSSPAGISEEGDENLASDNLAPDVSPTVVRNEARESPVSSEKLDMLLDRCKRVQESIDKKLFIYF